MKKKDYLSLAVYAAGFILVWNLLDFLYSTFIRKTAYHFALTQDMILPLSMMILIQIVQMSSKKKK